jgi:hypothetical protein
LSVRAETRRWANPTFTSAFGSRATRTATSIRSASCPHARFRLTSRRRRRRKMSRGREKISRRRARLPRARCRESPAGSSGGRGSRLSPLPRVRSRPRPAGPFAATATGPRRSASARRSPPKPVRRSPHPILPAQVLTRSTCRSTLESLPRNVPARPLRLARHSSAAPGGACPAFSCLVPLPRSRRAV